jgi:hypothetical protein
VQKTEAAIVAIADVFGRARCRWFLDKPVSNSGRLGQRLREFAEAKDLPWTVDLVFNPDRSIIEAAAQEASIAATSDGFILDNTEHWVDVPGEVAASETLALLDLSPS